MFSNMTSTKELTFFLSFLAFVVLVNNVNLVRPQSTNVLTPCKIIVGDKVFMCYWGTWSYWRTPENFTGINNVTHEIMSLDPGLDFLPGTCQWDPAGNPVCGVNGLINQTMALKSQNPNLKILVAIGGWSQGSKNFSEMAKGNLTRYAFIESVVTFINEHGFDGLDFDWEYPGLQGADPEEPENPELDRENFVTLLRELREAFDTAQGVRYLYLTAAVAASITSIDVAYDVPGISRHLDYINIMAYDLKMYVSEPHVGHHSPLYYKAWEEEIDKNLTVSSAVKYWIAKGAPAEKLTLGIGAYGKTYLLSDPSHSFYDLAIGPGGKQPASKEEGTIFYNEICDSATSSGSDIKYYFDYEYYIPFAKRDRSLYWIGYDDEDSVMEKVDFADNLGLGGMMIWALDYDDFDNWCGGWYKFGIAGTIKQRMEYNYAKKLKEGQRRAGKYID